MRKIRVLDHGCKQFLLMLIIFGSSIAENALAQCAPQLQSMSVSVSTNKVGFTAYTNDQLPIVKYYLDEKRAQSAFYLWNPLLQTYKFENKQIFIGTVDINTGLTSWNYSGTSSYSDPGGSANGSITNSATGEWDFGGSEANGDGFDTWHALDSVIVQFGWATFQQGPTFQDGESGAAWADSYSTFSGQWKQISALGVEYTDGMLRGHSIGLMPPYPTDYITNWNGGSGLAIYALSTDHVSCTTGKMKYKWFICGLASSPKGQKWRIDWDEITIYFDGSVSSTPMSETITANGDPNGQYGSVHEVGVPLTPKMIIESNGSMTSDGGESAGSGPGNGGPVRTQQ